MKRHGWMLVTLFGCAVTEDSGPSPIEGEVRRLEDFDPAHYEVVAIEDLAERDILVDVDGERIELASVAEADWVVFPRDPEREDAEAPASAFDDAELAASSSDPQAAGECASFVRYDIVLPEIVELCVETRTGLVCSDHEVSVHHDVRCGELCGSQTVICNDLTHGHSFSGWQDGTVISSGCVPCYP